MSDKFYPYGRQQIDDDDIEAVVNVMKSDWLTQGPTIASFESDLASFLGVKEVVACTSGTAALHLAMLAAGLGKGDRVLTSPITFLSSANCARFVGADVGFVDVDPDTGLMNAHALETELKRDTTKTIKAVVPVHMGGQPVDMPKIYELTHGHDAYVVDDACHAIGASYKHEGKSYRVGGNPHCDMTVFSFHPVKHVAMGEGGAVTTDDSALAESLRLYRNHGMVKGKGVESESAYDSDGTINPWYYEMQVLGFNYRLTDFQAALGINQLKKLPQSLDKRRGIAQQYYRLLEKHFADGGVRALKSVPDRSHAYHLFIVKIDFERFGVTRGQVMNRLREKNIGTQVHYIPLYRQPYYRRCCSSEASEFPGAEAYYAQALSIPMYPNLTATDCEIIITELKKVLGGNR